MTTLAALSAAILVAAGTYLLLGRNLQQIVLGFLLLSNGVNLAVLASTLLPAGAGPPIAGQSPPQADPLPQAFVLTAIVIGLGAAAFLLAMAVRLYQERGTDDTGAR